MHPILLVDDESSVLAALAFVFHVNGYETVSAQNGPEALQLAESQDFAVVFADIHMPRMDGFTFCRALQEKLRAADRPMPLLWLMTGAHTSAAAQKAKEVGARALLRKPFEYAPLLAEIQTALASPPTGAGGAVTATA